MNRFFLLLVTFAFLFSCKTFNPNSNQPIQGLTLVDSITFTLPFSLYPPHMARYYDHKTNTEFQYFADLSTSKQVQFFSLDGDLQFSVDLNEGIKTLGDAQDIEIISLDSIILLAPYTNNMVLLDSTGEVWKKIETNHILGFKQNKSESIELNSSLSSFSSMVNGTDLILYYNSSLYPLNLDPHEWMLKQKWHSWNSPKFMRINNIGSD